MTRDETVALFLECEAKRAEARAAALAGGKSEDDADKLAHEAAKMHWNGRAERADFEFCLFLNKGALDEETEAEAKAALEKRAAAKGHDFKNSRRWVLDAL